MKLWVKRGSLFGYLDGAKSFAWLGIVVNYPVSDLPVRILDGISYSILLEAFVWNYHTIQILWLTNFLSLGVL